MSDVTLVDVLKPFDGHVPGDRCTLASARLPALKEHGFVTVVAATGASGGEETGGDNAEPNADKASKGASDVAVGNAGAAADQSASGPRARGTATR